MSETGTGTLYIIPTPIGNLQDITLRALDCLKTLDILLCEDTRVTGKLLAHFELSVTLKSYHAHNEHHKTKEIIDYLKQAKRIGMVSDAGMPGISDPAYLLIREAIRESIPVIILPGPSAFLPALVGSGIPCDRFHFEGFLPHKKGRRTRLLHLSGLEVTFILYESPHRLEKCIAELIEYCGGDRPACVARELTKLHEEFIRGSLQDIQAEIQSRSSKIKGEIAIVVGR